LERWFFRACRFLQLRDDDMRLFSRDVFGFDYSKWQAAIDFQKTYNYGAQFLILRAAYGKTKDERFDSYMPEAAKYLPLSAYGFYDPAYHPIEQASKLIAVLEPYRQYIRRVWLDLEFWWDGAYKAPQHWKTYRDDIKKAGYAVGWYTRKTWWDARVGDYAAEFARDPLWAAQYSSALTLIPKGWAAAMIWQAGTPAIGGAVGAGSAEVDLDLWNTDYDFFLEWDGAPEPPENGATMYYGKMKAFTNVRNGPGPSYTDIGDLLLGDLIEADKKDPVTLWWRITKITRNGANVTLPGVESWCWFANVEEYTPSPVETLSVTVDVSVNVDGYKPGYASVNVELEKA
jgi:GH25 family lysozyme M1 (1,4-beta-N-acetylmuramidase)